MEGGNWGGILGNVFSALSFATALVASIAFFWTEAGEDQEIKDGWYKLAKAAFWTHSIAVFGIIATLFYLIYSHQYQYHYVWSHSSNELPVYYMISCFWEGQEGSFLLWTFWHCLLGMAVLWKRNKWTHLVMGTVSSVQLILSSMFLGIYIPSGIVQIFLILIILGILSWFWYRSFFTNSLSDSGFFHPFSLILSFVILGIIFRSFGGYYHLIQDEASNFTTTLFNFIWVLTIIYILFLVAGYFWGQNHTKKPLLSTVFGKSPISGIDMVAGTLLMVFGVVIAYYDLAQIKIGSSPFILLREALPNAPVFFSKPDFVPINGTGLNPLLQNYWMVIHPPTLFLGFASTVIPFGYVIGSLINKDYDGWIRPGTPWTIFSVMILGVGIIMGGYWAYETLSFGGYWNWDPVENASLVPWLIGIGAIHSMLTYRKSKTFLKMTKLMVVFTFLLVLYSTFLTRSGILGDTSVHTFTDLGLSGQLLVLLFFYFIGVFILFRNNWKNIPEKETDIPVYSGEFFLFLATIIFIFSGFGITLTTSLPVFNKIFGSNLAAPPEIQFFYYRWTVWFAISFGIFSGLGQYFYWKKFEKEAFVKAIFRPFFLSVTLAALIIIVLALSGWKFVFDEDYFGWLELANLSENPLSKASYYIRFFIFSFADEILLLAGLFTIFANIDVAYSLWKKKKTRIRTLGGTISHIGFGFMLIGMLFSSGYDWIVSKNINPSELSGFAEEQQMDNVLLIKGRPKYLRGYEVTYKGKKSAYPPISRLSLIEDTGESIKVKFDDVLGETYAMDLPGMGFKKSVDMALEVDMKELEIFLNENLRFLKPQLINNRTLYQLDFIKISPGESGIVYDSSSAFSLFPEAEVNEGMGLIAHPSRQIFLEKDLYVHVSSIPTNDEFKPEFIYKSHNLKIGDTASYKELDVILRKIEPLPQDSSYEIRVKAELEIIKDSVSYLTYPQYRVKKGGKINPLNHYHETISTLSYFTNIDPNSGTMSFDHQIQTTFEDDYTVIKAIHKPYINFLWLGTFILVAGLLISINRRVTENAKH